MLNLQLKQEVHQACISKVEDQINALQKALNQAKEALESETKSSAGDKHETGRAMAQLEMEKLGSQYKSALLLRQLLSRINPQRSNKSIQVGSLVLVNQAIYYLSVGLGKLELDSKAIELFVISPSAPLAQLLLRKVKGEQILFNGQKQKIEDCL